MSHANPLNAITVITRPLLFAVTVVAAMLVAVVPAHGAGARASVVGGSGAAITAIPHQAALLDRRAPSPYDGQYCGATVLDATHVLTAAHCLFLDGPQPQLKPVGDIRVLAGTASLRKPGEASEAAERDVAVAEMRLHPGYSASTHDADAAVLTTATPLYAAQPQPGSGARIAPIALQSEAQAAAAVDDRAPVTLSGWGFTGSSAPSDPRPAPSEYPSDLQSVVIGLVGDATCAAGYAGLNPITPRMLCAGGAGPGACYGDSGGPLTEDGGAVPLLAGIVSFGVGCAQPPYPDVFTRVADPAIAAFVRDAIASTPGAPPPADPAPPPADPPPASPIIPPQPVPPAAAAPSTIAPSPDGIPETDRVPPTQHLIRKRCTSLRCVFNVQVSDPLPSSGVRKLYVRQRWVSTRACRKGGKRPSCRQRVAHEIPARSLGAGRFLVRVRRLISRRSVLSLTGIDRSDNPARRSSLMALSSRRHIRRARLQRARLKRARSGARARARGDGT